MDDSWTAILSQNDAMNVATFHIKLFFFSAMEQVVMQMDSTLTVMTREVTKKINERVTENQITDSRMISWHSKRPPGKNFRI